MKSAHITSSIVLALSMLLLAGCKAEETASKTVARSTPPAVSNASSTNNSNQPVQPPDADRNTDVTKKSETPDSAKSKEPKLVGTYESREVQNEGVLTVISELKTIWVFFTDGNYSRVSQVKGKTYHSDSGTFRIEPPDKLVLTIQTTGERAKRKILNPPTTKSHIFSLSPDGDELRLTSAKGSIGIFRKVQNPS